MNVVALRALRAAQSSTSRPACRIIAGSRYPLSRRRAFHRSAISYQAPETPETPESSGDNRGEQSKPNDDVQSPDHAAVDGAAENDAAQNVEDINPLQRLRGRLNGRARANRMKPEGLPPVHLPDWFLRDNVKMFGEPQKEGSLAVYYGTNSVDPEEILENPEQKEKMAAALKSIMDCNLASTADAMYSVHVNVYQEIMASIRAGLTLRPSQGVLENKNLLRPILHLQCPKEGGSSFLDSIVETIATKLEADVINIDPVDLAQIVGPYTDENLAWTASSTSLLGYETSRVAGRLEEFDKDAHSPEDGEGALELQDKASGSSSLPYTPANAMEVRKKISSIFSALGDKLSQKANMGGKRPDEGMMQFAVINDSEPLKQATTRVGTDPWNDLKTTNVLDHLIKAAELKRESNNDAELSEESKPRDLIIQVKDFHDLLKTDGRGIIEKLQGVVNKQWQSGHNIMIVGTSALEEGIAPISRSDIHHLQSDAVEGQKRTIYVPHDRREEQDSIFANADKARIAHFNLRHIHDMINKLAGDRSISVSLLKDLDSALLTQLQEKVWTYSRVQRLSTMILGLEKEVEVVDGPVFARAHALLEESDEAKFAWGEAELKQEDANVDKMIDEMDSSNTSKNLTKDKLKQIRKNCNFHEKKLLSGVVIPSDINTTFSDVHVPKETVDALKTLTSLSLLRPEAFTYGVLATDKIPGLLLYGPPGTGKTLLAKAVAKESGATVLEVSGAEVNDMYVGEGEKNVRAIFSLAKKLSPCIVFIDEGDAIFAARGDSSKRSATHRELINQFLREWDGMNNLGAFIMVATNRPFDLDEAVLRRLPRRLLVDLPTEKDRQSILKIHLKDEILDSDVSLEKLAKDTPFYSGSDLKNLSVAAALACIREENELATAAAEASKNQEGGENQEVTYTYPEKRTLRKTHFEKALEEISASISEDMSTLAAIRKFDEKYGDRKGRRRKREALGFGGTGVVERDSEAVRVRRSVEVA